MLSLSREIKMHNRLRLYLLHRVASDYLLNGSQLDSSVDRNQPFVFTVGMSIIIKGLDEAFAGMTNG